MRFTSEQQSALLETIADRNRPGLLGTSMPQVMKKIRILFVIDQLCAPGGAERMLLKTIAGLPPSRFECHLATFKHDQAVELFANLPCPLHVFPLRRTYDLQAWKSGRQLRQFIRDTGIHIVHTFHETSDLWGGLIAKSAGCPVLVSSRRDMGFLRSLKHYVGYRVLSRCFDRVLSVSEQVREHCMRTDSLGANQVMTVYNGIDLAHVDRQEPDGLLRRSLGIPNSAPLVTAVGNIRRIKGIDVLLQAAQRVRQQMPDAVFLVVGKACDQAYFQELQETVKALGLHRHVKFAGAREDVIPILKASDVFCLPSWSEGFSNALLEAMACAVPCVATNVGGNKEAIQDGLHGYLIAPGQPGEMADRILHLLRHSAQARAIGRAGRRRVEEQFTFDIMIRRLVAVYDELLEGKSLGDAVSCQTGVL